MRKAWLAICFLLSTVALCQNAAQMGDIFESGVVPGLEQPFQKLYTLAARITDDPSYDFHQAHADQTNWPDIAQAQAQWDTAMAQNGNLLTQAERQNIDDCVAFLNAAIDETERGYLIHTTQQSNPLSARTVAVLYGEGKVDFAKCLPTGTVVPNAGTPGVHDTGVPGGNPPVNNSSPSGNGQSPGSSPGGVPTQNSGGTPASSPDTNPGGLPANAPYPQPMDPGTTVVALSCSYDVQNDPAPGADPPIAYQTGFNQAVAKCLQNQCTGVSLAALVFGAKYKVVRAMLSLSVVPAFLQVVFNPPAFSQSPDPYTRGQEEGTALCNYALQVATLGSVANAAANRLGPVIPVKPMSLTEPVIPQEPPPLSQPAEPPIPGEPVVGGQKPPPLSQPVSPQQAAAKISQWIKEINSTGCTKNCGIATINAVRVLFGEILMAAPAREDGMTEPEMESYLGTKFTQDHLTDEQMNDYLSGMPDGTISVIAGRNPAGAGHFFLAVKWNGQMEYWDAQWGRPMQAKEVEGWNFDINVVGNPLKQ